MRILRPCTPNKDVSLRRFATILHTKIGVTTFVTPC